MISSADFEKIKAVILDIDGVLTDGRIGYGGGHNGEIKYFHVRDGHGLKMASRAGLKIGILSGRSSEANEIRAKELGFDFVYQNCKNKAEGFINILQEQNLKAEECFYMGDDLVDIPVMRRAGLSAVPADGCHELDEFADIRTTACGGNGAVREAIEWLLKGKNLWQTVTARYYE